jgi:hypothetical protein
LLKDDHLPRKRRAPDKAFRQAALVGAAALIGWLALLWLMFGDVL